ncbi:MAG: helicase [Cressdnaviricota sp.]|nr:MAG: helicase [Cressdnaviricota sp.]
MPREPRWKNVCWTLFNPSTHSTTLLLEGLKKPKCPLRYLVCQPEVCPSTGKPHLQGYAEATASLTLSCWKSWLGSNEVHVEMRRGSAKQAREYCMKETSRMPGTGVWEWGSWVGTERGQRTDLDLLAEAALADMPLEELLQVEEIKPSSVMRHLNLYTKFRELVRPKRSHQKPLTVLCLTGPSGSGKSLAAAELWPDAYWTPAGPLQWWDQYSGHKVIVIDEFDSNKVDYRRLLRILDRYAPMVEIKCGFTRLNADLIVLTSILHPDEWYETEADKSELQRRLTATVRMQKTPSGLPDLKTLKTTLKSLNIPMMS